MLHRQEKLYEDVQQKSPRLFTRRPWWLQTKILHLIEETLVRDQLRTNTDSSVETHVRDTLKLRRRDSIRDFCTAIKLWPKTSHVSTVFDMTITYSLSEMIAELFDNSGPIPPSTVMSFFVVQKSSKNYSRSETNHIVADIPLLPPKAHSSNCTRILRRRSSRSSSIRKLQL